MQFSFIPLILPNLSRGFWGKQWMHVRWHFHRVNMFPYVDKNCAFISCDRNSRSDYVTSHPLAERMAARACKDSGSCSCFPVLLLNDYPRSNSAREASKAMRDTFLLSMLRLRINALFSCLSSWGWMCWNIPYCIILVATSLTLRD